MPSDHAFESPINSIPPVVAVLCLIAAGVELVLSAADAGFVGGARGIGWRSAAQEDYGFAPAALSWIIERGDFGFDLIKVFVTYPFVHASFTNALFGIAILLALGKFVGEALGATATFVLFFGSAIIGAIVFGLLVGGTTRLIGLFPPVYGLIGAYTYVLWLRLGQSGKSQLAAFRLIGFLLALQLVFGIVFGGAPIWIAELSAFVAGFGMSTVLAPGGWQALLYRLRERR
jgi:membrane associated rhomboid family serine protease